MPVVTDLTFDPATNTLLCISTSGPATTVVWSQDGVTLQDDLNFIETSQRIVSSELDLYFNTLRLSRSNETQNVGIYRCHVINNRGNDSIELTVPESVIVQDVFRLGSPASLRCVDTRGSGDAVLDNVIEWVNATMGVVSAAANVSELEISFDAVDFVENNTVLSCRISNHVTTSIIITVQGTAVEMRLRW